MKCPKCDATLMPGRLLNNGMVWTGNEKWMGREFYEINVKGCEALPAFGVMAYRCPSCNLLSFYTSEEEKA